MSPQRKGLVPPADEERIRKAIELRALVELELVDAVLTAMKHGGSIREVAAASGLSERTIIRWRKGQGLPTHDDWHKDSRERRERLYEAYPWLRNTEAMIRQMKSDRPDQ
ncbi:MAG TPA: hypothetical protein VF444_01345 [Pseudonocardiaceae bacterium]